MNEAESFSLSNDLTEVVNGKDKRGHKMVVMRLKRMTLKEIGGEFGRSPESIRIALWKIFKKSRERSISWQDSNAFHENHFSNCEIEKLKITARHLSNK